MARRRGNTAGTGSARVPAVTLQAAGELGDLAEAELTMAT
jgi:hypothetical protein